MSEKNYYEILGVDQGATTRQITAAKNKVIKQWQPDKHNNESEEAQKKAEEETQRINEAYEALADKDKRAEYDRKHGFADVEKKPDAKPAGKETKQASETLGEEPKRTVSKPSDEQGAKSVYWSIDLSAGCSRGAHIENILHAAQEGNIADITHFVDLNKADVNTEDRWGNTPLHYAAWFNPDVAVLQYLVEKGGDASVLNYRGRTPLDVASTEAKRKILRGDC